MDRVRTALKAGTEWLNSLFHHLTVELLWKAYESLNRKAKPREDGQDWSLYNEHLQGNLTALHERLHSGRYRARTVKRGWISKADGSKRPIVVTSVEDIVVQQALVWVLESIYEVDCNRFSYGYRPKRSQHNALVRECYDHIDYQWLMRFLEHRTTDRGMLKLLRQMLRTGVIEARHWPGSRVGMA